MVIHERLFHVFGGNRNAGGFAAYDGSRPGQLNREWLAAWAIFELRHGQREPHVILPGGNGRSTQHEIRGGALQFQCDLAGEAVAAYRVHGKGNVGARANVEAGRHHAQLEVRLRLADAQAVSVLRPALMLGVRQLEVIGSLGRQFKGNKRIGLMGDQACPFIFKIVVEGQLFAGCVGQAKRGIERRAEPARDYLGDNLLAGAAVETEERRFTRLRDAPVHDDRKLHFLRFGPGETLPGRRFRQRIQGEFHGIGSESIFSHGHLIQALGLVFEVLEVLHDLSGRQIPAVGLNRGARPGFGAEREDAGDDRQFTEGHAVNEILATAVDRIVNLGDVIVIAGDFVVQQRVRMEEEMIGRRQLLTLGVAQRDGCLKPAGNGVGDVWNQFPGSGSDHHVLSFFGVEAILIAYPGHHLAVRHDGKGDFERRIRLLRGLPDNRNPAIDNVVGLTHAAEFFHNLRQIAHAKHDWIAESAVRFHPHFTRTHRGVLGNGHLQDHGVGEGRNVLPALPCFRLFAEFLDPFPIRFVEDYFLRTGRRRFERCHALLVQLLHLFPQELHFLSVGNLHKLD